MRPRANEIRRAVWAFVTLYAALTVYAAVAGDDRVALATGLLFGAFVLGFGTLLLVRANGRRLIAAGGLLTVGGGLELLAVVAPEVGWIADAPVVVGMGVYVYERWVRSGTKRPDPLEPKDA